jgi:hypothetical protein
VERIEWWEPEGGPLLIAPLTEPLQTASHISVSFAILANGLETKTSSTSKPIHRPSVFTNHGSSRCLSHSSGIPYSSASQCGGRGKFRRATKVLQLNVARRPLCADGHDVYWNEFVFVWYHHSDYSAYWKRSPYDQCPDHVD